MGKIKILKNKRRLILVLVSVALLSGVIFGGTFASLMDKGEVTNIVTYGHVDIELSEPKFDKNTKNTDIMDNIYPGQIITKDPTISVDKKSSDAFIRAKITFSDSLSDQDVLAIEESFDLQDGWCKASDGYYYYNDIVSSGDSKILFDSFIVPNYWSDSIDFAIDVEAEAIQADNFVPSYDDLGNITGWFIISDDGKSEAVTTETYNN